ncbi:MAG: N-acetyltransferase [Chitinophagaceae bacterium]|nr:N-acetyltransferase [Chitinophagaceae bacterium]
MNIQHKETEGKGMFFLESEEGVLAEMTYTVPAPGKMIIAHTEVDDSLQGKGVGVHLLETLVEYARANNIKVKPLCTFAKATFDRKPELQDVLWL